MDWEEGLFNAAGRPVCDKPKGPDPDKWIEHGGLDTMTRLLRPQPGEIPAFSEAALELIRENRGPKPKSHSMQGQRPPEETEPEAAGKPMFVFGPPGVRATSAGDPFHDHKFSPMGPPPVPDHVGPKRLRSKSGDKAPEPKAAKGTGASGATSSTQGLPGVNPTADHARTELLRVKAPPPKAPANIREANAAARARGTDEEINAMTDEEVVAHYAKVKSAILRLERKVEKEIRTCRILMTNQLRSNQKDYLLQHVYREVVPLPERWHQPGTHFKMWLPLLNKADNGSYKWNQLKRGGQQINRMRDLRISLSPCSRPV